MPFERTYIGESEQYVPDLHLTVRPGDVVQFDEEPDKDDPQFVTASKARPHASRLKAARQYIEAQDAKNEPDPPTEDPAAGEVAENQES